MTRVLRAEWIKLRRSPLPWLVLLTPILYSIFIIWYFSGRTISDQLQISIYDAYFQVWAAIVVPLGAGLLPGLMSYQEAQAGSFQGLLASRIPRILLYFGKMAMLVLLSTISTALGVILLIVSVKCLVGIPLSPAPFIYGALVAELTTIPLLAMQLWISLALGLGPSIGVGAGGLLLGALSLTSLGDHYWQYLPWGWTARFVMAPGAAFYYEIMPEFENAPFAAVVFLLLTLGGGLLWFGRWEGKKMHD